MRRVARGWCLWREGVVNESVGLEMVVVVPVCVDERVVFVERGCGG